MKNIKKFCAIFFILSIFFLAFKYSIYFILSFVLYIVACTFYIHFTRSYARKNMFYNVHLKHFIETIILRDAGILLILMALLILSDLHIIIRLIVHLFTGLTAYFIAKNISRLIDKKYKGFNDQLRQEDFSYINNKQLDVKEITHKNSTYYQIIYEDGQTVVVDEKYNLITENIIIKKFL